MKKIILLSFGLFLVNSCAQETVKGNGNVITKTVNVSPNFHSVESAGAFDVTILEGSQDGKIQLEGESNIIDKIEVEVENNVLVLKQKPGFNFRNAKNIHISFRANTLSGVGLSGSGNIDVEGFQNSDDMKVSLSGSGNIKSKHNSKTTKVSISGSGNISLTGTTQDLNVGISGSGNIDCYNLVSKTAKINVSGSGDTKVNVSEDLQGSLAGSGNIYYKGKPMKVNVHASGSGDVIEKD